MEALLTSSAYIRKEENESKALLVSGKGEIYRADLESGEIKWLYDTEEPTYKTFRDSGVVEYVDIGLEDEYPCYYSLSETTVIPPGEDMGKCIKYLFKENPCIEINRKEFYLNFSTGKKSEKYGQDVISITRTDFKISISDRWYFMYSNLDAFFPSSEKRSKCFVIYGRTPESFIEICNKYRLGDLPGQGILARTINLGKRISLNKFVNKKGNISFFLGYLRDSKVCYEVFVKRVPKMDGYLQVLDLYKKIGHNRYLARLLSVESDDEYEYLAFEYNKQYASLANLIISADDSEIQRVPLDYSDIQRASILRHVIQGLMDVHASGVLHCNITPDHVLVSSNTYGGYAIKFCGFSLSQPCVAEDKFNVSDLHIVERQNLARLIVNMMTSLSNNVEHTGIPDGYQYRPLNKNAFNKYMNKNKTTNVVRDLVLKLMNAEYKMHFMEMYNHLLFWSWHEQLMLLKEASDEIFAQTLPDIDDDDARTVFDGDWESKIIEKGGEKWLKKMKEMKEVYEESEDRKEEENRKEVHKKNGRGGGSGRGRGGRHGRGGNGKAEGGNGKAEGGNGKAEGDKAKRYVYNPKKLRDLLRLVRNGVNHRCKGEYPGDNLLELWEFLHDAFPALFTVVYNHVLKNGKGTDVYVNYCRKPFM